MGFPHETVLVIITRVRFHSPAPALRPSGNQRLARLRWVREGKVRTTAREVPAFLPLQPQQTPSSFLPARIPARWDFAHNPRTSTRVSPSKQRATIHDHRICPRTRFDPLADLRHPEFQRTELPAKSAPSSLVCPHVAKCRAKLATFLHRIGLPEASG